MLFSLSADYQGKTYFSILFTLSPVSCGDQATTVRISIVNVFKPGAIVAGHATEGLSFLNDSFAILRCKRSSDLVLPFRWRLQKSGIWFSRALKKQQVSHNVPPLFSAISPLRIEVHVSNMQPVSSSCFIKLRLVRLKIPNCCFLLLWESFFVVVVFCSCFLHQTRDS